MTTPAMEAAAAANNLVPILDFKMPSYAPAREFTAAGIRFIESAIMPPNTAVAVSGDSRTIIRFSAAIPSTGLACQAPVTP